MTKKTKLTKKKVILSIIYIVLTVYFLVFFYSLTKPLPEGISLEGGARYVSEDEIDFLYDLNYLHQNGSNVIEQEIFKNVFFLVDNAENFIIIDMFLFNADYTNKERFIPLTTTLKDKLISKKKSNPNLQIYFITDEINNFYGSYTSEEIKELKENNINVIITDLTKLRDSNPAYSSFWRIFLQPFGTSGDGWITHPLGNKNHNVTLRSYLKLINTKANHRKVIVADFNSSIYSLVTSANPHEASSLHSNVALLIKDGIHKDIIEAEKSVAKFSSSEIKINNSLIPEISENKDIQIQFLTEQKIRSNLLKDIDSSTSGETIDLAMFYLSDRKIIKSLLNAQERGVNVNIILDSNKDAFAREKNGIPNRQVAYELFKKSDGKINIRWYNTRGEQFHTKMIIIKKKDRTIVYLGSANFTKRNLGDLNLEADVKLSSPNNKSIIIEIDSYFNRLWNNVNGSYTLDFESYKDSSKTKYLLYRFQEFSGFSSL